MDWSKEGQGEPGWEDESHSPLSSPNSFLQTSSSNRLRALLFPNSFFSLHHYSVTLFTGVSSSASSLVSSKLSPSIELKKARVAWAWVNRADFNTHESRFLFKNHLNVIKQSLHIHAFCLINTRPVITYFIDLLSVLCLTLRQSWRPVFSVRQ